jgi:hypothetical protein
MRRQGSADILPEQKHLLLVMFEGMRKILDWSRKEKTMKRLTLFFMILLLPAAGADARTYEASKKAGDYEVGIVIDHNPPLAIGDNNLEMEIKDRDGKQVTDAQVLVNYYMPPMPRMPPMNYRTAAKMKRGKYHATMKFIMAGPWYIAIIIHHGGKTSTTKINVDAQ